MILESIMVRLFFLGEESICPTVSVLAWNPRCLGQPYSIPIDTNGSLLLYGDDGPFMPN